MAATSPMSHRTSKANADTTSLIGFSSAVQNRAHEETTSALRAIFLSPSQQTLNFAAASISTEASLFAAVDHLRSCASRGASRVASIGAKLNENRNHLVGKAPIGPDEETK